MAYATYEDILERKGTDISDTNYVMALLEDAAIIIDAYNRNATDEANGDCPHCGTDHHICPVL